jgi:hypothetical protein
MNKVQVFSPAWALLFISGAAVSSLQELKKDNTFNRIYRIKEKDNTFDRINRIYRIKEKAPWP